MGRGAAKPTSAPILVRAGFRPVAAERLHALKIG
jgi:hypothetical protein